MNGVIIKTTGKHYSVKSDEGDVLDCRLKGKLRILGIKSTNPFVVGDRVEVSCESNQWLILSLHKRKNYILRKSVNLSKLIIGTFGNGVYQTNINSIGEILSVSNINSEIYDYTIFPNPIDENFSLLLDLKNISTCNVTIYDELGRQIFTDKNINVINGVNQINLSLNGFKSGVYFIDVSIGEKSLVKQIIKK